MRPALTLSFFFSFRHFLFSRFFRSSFFICPLTWCCKLFAAPPGSKESDTLRGPWLFQFVQTCHKGHGSPEIGDWWTCQSDETLSFLSSLESSFEIRQNLMRGSTTLLTSHCCLTKRFYFLNSPSSLRVIGFRNKKGWPASRRLLFLMFSLLSSSLLLLFFASCVNYKSMGGFRRFAFVLACSASRCAVLLI